MIEVYEIGVGKVFLGMIKCILCDIIFCVVGMLDDVVVVVIVFNVDI